MSGVVSILPLHAVSVWTGKTLPVPDLYKSTVEILALHLAVCTPVQCFHWRLFHSTYQQIPLYYIYIFFSFNFLLHYRWCLVKMRKGLLSM